MKGGLAWQRFQKRRQYNRIVGQLNQLHAAGYTDEDIRGAGKNPWREFSQYGKAIPKDQLIMPTAPGAGIPPTGVPTAETPVVPQTAGMTGPTGFAGDMGYAPRTPGPTTPAWMSGISGSAGGAGAVSTGPSTLPGVSGTAGSRPAWWSSSLSPWARWMAGTAQAGLGFASQLGGAVPTASGTAGRSAIVTLPTSPALDYPTLPPATNQPSGGGGGYYYDGNYYPRRRRGGGRSRGRSYQTSYVEPGSREAPGWAIGGSANWTFG